jgi:hypothetical protein
MSREPCGLGGGLHRPPRPWSRFVREPFNLPDGSGTEAPGPAHDGPEAGRMGAPGDAGDAP